MYDNQILQRPTLTSLHRQISVFLFHCSQYKKVREQLLLRAQGLSIKLIYLSLVLHTPYTDDTRR